MTIKEGGVTDIQKLHEDFCKVFKPEFGTIFNIDSVQFEPLEDKYYQDAQRLNWTFAGWLLGTKAQAVPEGFVLVSVEQLNQWGHMANYAQEYGCPECFESRGYAHNLACEINELFVIEAQEPTNDI